MNDNLLMKKVFFMSVKRNIHLWNFFGFLPKKTKNFQKTKKQLQESSRNCF